MKIFQNSKLIFNQKSGTVKIFPFKLESKNSDHVMLNCREIFINHFTKQQQQLIK
jgi:hypothetical protein